MKDLERQLKLISNTIYILANQLENLKIDVPNQKTNNKNVTKKPLFSDSKGERTSITEIVFQIIKKSRKGETSRSIIFNTGLGKRQVANSLYKLKKQYRITTISRGLYIKAKRIKFMKHLIG